ANADWLDNSTRANAQTKLSKFVHLLGGPEKPQMYPTLTLDSKSYLNNRWKLSQVNIDTNLKLNGQPVDRRRFNMAPHEVNAYYNRYVNQIVFPAGVLQKPFFDRQFDAAQNFGAIGMFIGHEITHGFDNIGRNYDGDGNLKQWWSNATNDAFKTKAQCISDQYANLVVTSEVTGVVLGKIRGNITLGENIADNGGLKTSFRAYHEYLKEHPSQYTEEAGDKLFYLSYAQAWCSKSTDAYLRAILKTKYPPFRYRVTGALRNNAEFARVFQCPTDSYLNPSKKCLFNYPIKYRPDIDGLQTFVVVPVVLFHAYPLSINGGFTGVDVFFVIAGYLISGILFKENVKGSLTYADFYSRRIHRMFPALLLVLTFTLVVGCVWLLDKAV
ncbi:hypothetical protein B5M09_012551, partial [Aphanomyces astaci]